MDARRAVAVAAGAVLGASLRWAATRMAGPDGLDLVLLGVNVAGCLLLGTVSRLPPHRSSPGTQPFLEAGLSGSLTTWSSLALRTAEELRDGAWLAGGAWLVLNLAVGLAAAWVGRWLGHTRWHGRTMST